MVTILVTTVVWCCVAPATALAGWYRTVPVSGGVLTFGTVDLRTAGARSADWSATVLTVPTGSWVYAAVNAPAPVVTNTGTVTARVSVDGLSTAPALATTTADASTLAARLSAELRVVSDTSCNQAAFAAGTSLAAISPVGQDRSGLLVDPGAGQPLTVATDATLCARYQLSDPTGLRGRTVTVTWTLLAHAGSALAAPVLWKHRVQVAVPAPAAPTGSGALPACSVDTTVLGIVSKVTISWGWPGPANFADPNTGENPASFGLTINSSSQPDVAGNRRQYAIEAGLLTTVLGNVLGGTATFRITAKSGDLTSPPLTVKLEMGLAGIFSGCTVVSA